MDPPVRVELALEDQDPPAPPARPDPHRVGVVVLVEGVQVHVPAVEHVVVERLCPHAGQDSRVPPLGIKVRFGSIRPFGWQGVATGLRRPTLPAMIPMEAPAFVSAGWFPFAATYALLMPGAVAAWWLKRRGE